MSADESEVVDYIDTLLVDAQAGGEVARIPLAAQADATPAAPVASAAPAPTDPDVPSGSPPLVQPPEPTRAADASATAAAQAAPPPSGTAAAPAAISTASRAPAPDASSPPVQIASAPRWLRVLVGKASYAVELLRVQEVVRLVPIVPMRGARPAVLGVMNLRGRIVPVFDLGLWLGSGRIDTGDQCRIVVVERADELIGVLVSAVEDVVTLGRDRIEPPLPGGAAGVVLGVARVGSVPTVLFDAYALYG